MSLFKNAKQIIIPKDMINTETWITDEELERFFLDSKATNVLSEKSIAKESHDDNELNQIIYSTNSRDNTSFYEDFGAGMQLNGRT